MENRAGMDGRREVRLAERRRPGADETGAERRRVRPPTLRRSFDPITVKSNPDLARGRDPRSDRRRSGSKDDVPSLNSGAGLLDFRSQFGLATSRRLSKRGPPPYTLDVMTRARLNRRGLMAGALGLSAVGLSAVGALSACSRTPAPTDESGRVRLRVTAGDPADALHGGFYQALAVGAYERRGLSVEILAGRPGADIPALLAASAVELAIGRDSFLPLRLIAERAPVKAVAAFLQKDPVVLLAHPGQQLEDLTVLRGRKLLMEPKDQDGFWTWLRARFDLAADQAQPGAVEDNLKAFRDDADSVLIARLTDGGPEAVARAVGFQPLILSPAEDG